MYLTKTYHIITEPITTVKRVLLRFWIYNRNNKKEEQIFSIYISNAMDKTS